jgi:choline dehydrogenase-like flavoprotein
LRTNAVARRVLVDTDGRAKGVAYIDRETKQEIEVYARTVVLAACCTETSRIMLNSKSRQWPAGIANSSGQVGRNLCDHLSGGPAFGYLPQLLGQPSSPDNVSASTVAWMPRWQNLKNPREEKFIRGYSLYPGGGCGEFPGYYERFQGFGSEFKRNIKRYYPTPVSFYCQAPSLPSKSNYMDIDPEVKDIYGIPAPRFHFQWGPNELLMWEHSKAVCSEVIRAAGGEVWGTAEGCLKPGSSQHETGTCRMGGDPKKFVTNRFGQCHDVPNLFCCDASVFPSCTDKTTTLSIMAFTLRTCEYLMENLRTGTV